MRILDQPLSYFLEQIKQASAKKLSKYETHCQVHGKFVEAHDSGECMQCRDVRLAKIKQERESSLRIERIKEVGFGKIYRNASLLQNQHQHQREAIELLSQITPKTDRNLIISGIRGTGKTHLAAALVNEISEELNCRYVKYYRLADIKIHDYHDFIRLVECDFLIIDEYGAADNNFKCDLIHDIVDHRVENELPIIILTNLTPNELAEQMSDVVFSRFSKKCDVVVLNGPDLRLI